MNEITVQYERKFSDGNFGSEGLSLSWTTAYDDGDIAIDPELIAMRCTAISDALRSAVLSELAKSTAPRVANQARYELDPRTPGQPKAVVAAGGPSDDVDEEDRF